MTECTLPDGAAIHVAFAGGPCDLPDGAAIHVAFAASGVTVPVRARHRADAALRRPVSAWHTASAGDLPIASARHTATSAVRLRIAGRHASPARLRRSEVAARHRADAALRYAAIARHTAPAGDLARLSARHISPAWVHGDSVAARWQSPAALRAPLAARHASPSELRLDKIAAHHAVAWAPFGQRAARHVAPFGPTVQACARHVAPFGPTVQACARHVAPFGPTVQARARHVSLHAILSAVRAWQHSPARLLSANPLAARHRAASSCPDARVEILAGPNHLLHDGRVVPLGEGTELSADEGSPVWIAALDVLHEDDYARIALGDPLTLLFWGQPIALICDGRRFSRADAAPSVVLSAISPGALLGTPWAVPVALGAVELAQTVVERLLGQPVAWQLPNWRLPDSAGALQGTPLELARQIVGAVAGELDSLPDGSLVARPRYPVSPPAYSSATPVATLTDRDLLAHRDQAEAASRENRFVIASGDPSATADQIQIDSVQDPEDPHAYTIRAYPHPWRPVDLVHTGDAATQIGPRTEVLTEQDELVVIQSGAATLAYPLADIRAQSYRYADLGRVSVVGRDLTTAQADYSLLSLQYRARAWQWRATNARTETIQFLAVE
ncbi:hypothetical protein [Thiocystis violascens]|uniref:Uncharacterized protein n=1 Tax=Thiocystis violascens (strain ATCC 17096 / DSM 198 / 6111) TaxID=765911 RepID=I3Y8P3_THIV6|nr:hypothetical protein [Thiocystis violascens]AFL73361.1 hypothetical protein Thivi_1348 [Thiocystis violascens DSM 198]